MSVCGSLPLRGDTVSYDGPAGHHPNMAMIYPLDIEAPPLILDCLGAEKAMDVAVRHFDGVKLAQRCPHVLLICSANLRQSRFLHRGCSNRQRDHDVSGISPVIVRAGQQGTRHDPRWPLSRLARFAARELQARCPSAVCNGRSMTEAL